MVSIRDTLQVFAYLLIATAVLLMPSGCSLGGPSPEEIKTRQSAALAVVAAQLVAIEGKDKKAPLREPERVVIDCGPVSFDPAIVNSGLEVFFREGVPTEVSALQPYRYEGTYCDRSERVALGPAESGELARLLDFYFSKQYVPMTFGGCFGPVYNFKITWYAAKDNVYVSSSVPESYEAERPRERLAALVRTLQSRCLTIPMLLESLGDDNPCMRSFALKHIDDGLRGDRAFLAETDEAVPALLRTLDDSEVPLRIIAAECLFMLVDERHAYREQATDVVLQILRTGDPGERRSAVSTLYACAASRKNDAVDALLVALRDEHHEVRHAAAGALRHFRDVPERAEEILGGLRAALNDEDESVRALAAGSIEALRQ